MNHHYEDDDIVGMHELDAAVYDDLEDPIGAEEGEPDYFDSMEVDYDDDALEVADADYDDVDGLLDSLMAEDEEDPFGDGLSERRRRRKWLANLRYPNLRKIKLANAARKLQRKRMARALHSYYGSQKIASGRNLYGKPVSGGVVRQSHLSSSLGKVGEQLKLNSAAIKKNAKGIVGNRARMDKNSGRIDVMKANLASVATLNRAQNRRIANNSKAIQLDGALEFARGVSINTDEAGGRSIDVDVTALIQGAVKSGFIGKGSGFFSTPAGIAATAFLVANGRSLLELGTASGGAAADSSDPASDS